jgi:predicted small integral membrane protein
MIETRIVKSRWPGRWRLFAGFVALGNLTDYETNYAFVRHVLSRIRRRPATA